MKSINNRELEGNTAQLTFLANIGHELRTPMNSILGFIQLVASDSRLPSPLRTYIEQADVSAHKLLDIIDTLLDLSKLKAGLIELENSAFDINYLMDTVKNSYMGAVKRGIQFNLIKNNSVRFFYGDPSRLEQVLSEIVGNAIKFTDSGSISLHLETAREDRREQYHTVKIVVRDTGIGVKEDDFDKVFRPFTQVDDSSTRRYSGIGSGMAVVHELITLMGGTVRFTSQYGRGTTVTVTIPLKEADERRVEKSGLSRRKPVQTAMRTFHILVVDDITINLDLARANLERAGHRVTLAASGMDALDICREQMPEIIFMDLHMPLMDGEETVRHIRQLETDGSRPFIVAVTASVIKEDFTRIASSGFDYVVSKPVQYSELMKKVNALVSASSGISGVPQKPQEGPVQEPQESALYSDLSPQDLADRARAAFDTYNPDEILPFVDALSLKTGVHSFDDVSEVLKEYDFDRALVLFKEGLDSLGIERNKT
ncbi:MAG: hybrid sensor histidine kinase/response regulator [Fibrobacterota bacterium]